MIYSSYSESDHICAAVYNDGSEDLIILKGDIELCDCEALCDADSSCTAFVHGKPHGVWYRCFLFDGEISDNPDITSTMAGWDPRCYVKAEKTSEEYILFVCFFFEPKLFLETKTGQ